MPPRAASVPVLRPRSANRTPDLAWVRKILAGAWVLARADQDPEAARRLTQGLDAFLERDRDRALFDLSPRPDDGGQ